MQDDVNIYRSSPSIPEAICLAHLLPSVRKRPYIYRPSKDPNVIDSLSDPDDDDSPFANTEEEFGAGGDD